MLRMAIMTKYTPKNSIAYYLHTTVAKIPFITQRYSDRIWLIAEDITSLYLEFNDNYVDNRKDKQSRDNHHVFRQMIICSCNNVIIISTFLVLLLSIETQKKGSIQEDRHKVEQLLLKEACYFKMWYSEPLLIAYHIVVDRRAINIFA